MESSELEFEYKKLGGARHESRRVQPYHLGCVENQWYLFAFDLERKQLRTFALPRMKKIRATRTVFRRPADFSISSHLSESFGVFTGKGNHRIRVRFDAFAAQLIAERQWHPSQKIEWLADGTLELTMNLATLEEITRWILSWGAHATVITPPELRATVADTARNLASRYL
jgi:proteasome accessory factor B